MNGPLHVAPDGIYCNLCPTIVYQTWQLALEHMKLEHPALLADLTAPRHLHVQVRTLPRSHHSVGRAADIYWPSDDG